MTNHATLPGPIANATSTHAIAATATLCATAGATPALAPTRAQVSSRYAAHMPNHPHRSSTRRPARYMAQMATRVIATLTRPSALLASGA